MKTLAFALIAVACVAAGCKSEGELTEVMLEVRSDLAVGTEIDALRLTIAGSAGPPNVYDLRLGAMKADGVFQLPVSIGIVRGKDSLDAFGVTAAALFGANEAEVVTRTHEIPFVAGEVRAFVITLNRACAKAAKVVCSAESTCSEGACRPIRVSPEELATWPLTDTKPMADAAAPDATRKDASSGDTASSDVADPDKKDAGSTPQDGPQDGPKDTVVAPEAITVTGSTPAADTASVAPNTSIELTLSRAPDSAPAGLVQVTAGGNPVPGTTMLAGTKLTFSPAADLPLAATVEVKVVPPAMGSAFAPATIRFRTRDGRWSMAPQKVADTSTFSFASNAKGNAILGWHTTASVFTVVAIGSETFAAAPLPFGKSYGLNVALDGSDRAAAVVYSQGSGSFGSLALIRRDGASWMPSDESFLASGDANNIIGNLYARSNTAGDLAIVYRHVTAGTKVAIKPAGGNWVQRAVAASQSQVYSFELGEQGQYVISSTAAGTTDLVVSSGSATASLYQHRVGEEHGPAALLANGEVIVASVQGPRTVTIRRLALDGTEIKAEATVAASADVGSVSLAVHPGGRAVAAWNTADGSAITVVHRNADGTWTLPTTVDQVGAAVTTPKLVVDASGNAIMAYAWSASSVYARRYTPSSGWQSSTLMNTGSPSALVDDIVLTIDAAGRAWLVWGQASMAAGSETLAMRFK